MTAEPHSLTPHMLHHMAWREALNDAFETPSFAKLQEFYKAQRARDVQVYPEHGQVFQALNLTNLPDVQVVILGQDPYHGPGQAMGLSFSVPADVRVPPSLRNIYKEIEADLGAPSRTQGDLSTWAEQGVLLLNTVLTVEAAKAGSHRRKGWEAFTDAVIKTVSDRCDNCVFLLWGASAIAKTPLIHEDRHLVLTTVHPSPLSAYRGFLGCQHFSATNAYLHKHGRAGVRW